jgi:DnaJ-class molecular chaperone
MKKTKRCTIIDKSDQMMCWICNGTGWIPEKNVCCTLFTVICPTCNGSGIFREGHFIIVDEKNKIAFDSDSGG